MIRNLLGEASLPQPLERRILSLADGNPLFVEQMLSMLIDDGLLHEQAGHWIFSGAAAAVPVPGNVSSLLGARLDRLRPAELRVAESASVIGLEFSSSAVLALLEDSNTSTDLEPALAACAANSSSARQSQARPTASGSVTAWSVTRRTRACSSEPGPGCMSVSPPGSPATSGPGSPSTKRSSAITSSSRSSIGPSLGLSMITGRSSARRRRSGSARPGTAPWPAATCRPRRTCCCGPPPCLARKTPLARCSSSTPARRWPTSASWSGPSLS